MKHRAIVLPWVIVVVMAGIIVVQYRAVNSGTPDVKAAPPVPETAQPIPEAMRVDSERDGALDALRLENESLRGIVASQSEKIASLTKTLEAPRARAESAPGLDRESAPRREEDRAAMAEQFAEMRIERRYGAFLAGLGLSPDREYAIREALLRVLVDTAGDRGLTEGEYAAWMRDELAKVLSPNELAEFDEYQEGPHIPSSSG